MSSVFLDSPTNSTLFTTCCQVAITDSQENCPRCGEKVEPLDGRSRWEKAYGPIRRGERGYGDSAQVPRREA